MCVPMHATDSRSEHKRKINNIIHCQLSLIPARGTVTYGAYSQKRGPERTSDVLVTMTMTMTACHVWFLNNM